MDEISIALRQIKENLAQAYQDDKEDNSAVTSTQTPAAEDDGKTSAPGDEAASSESTEKGEETVSHQHAMQSVQAKMAHLIKVINMYYI